MPNGVGVSLVILDMVGFFPIPLFHIEHKTKAAFIIPPSPTQVDTPDVGSVSVG